MKNSCRISCCSGPWGVSLDQIKTLLDSNTSEMTNALLIRLGELNNEIGALKQKQQNIVDLFKSTETFAELLSGGNMEILTGILLSGISPTEWHTRFEAISPEIHNEFLKIVESIPEDKKAAFLDAAKSLPEEEREQLKKIMKNNNLS